MSASRVICCSHQSDRCIKVCILHKSDRLRSPLYVDQITALRPLECLFLSYNYFLNISIALCKHIEWYVTRTIGVCFHQSERQGVVFHANNVVVFGCRKVNVAK